MFGAPVSLSPRGIPVESVASGAPCVNVSANGAGFPINLVTTGGIPMVVKSEPQPITPGPMEDVVLQQQGFNNYSRPFDLASDSMVLEMACTYDGNPTVSIAHGGQPLTILRQEKANGIMAIVAAGRGLTIESAALTITATGGNCNQGAIRVNEMASIAVGLSGWGYNSSGTGIPLPSVTMNGTSGGTVKGVFVNKGADRSHFDKVEGAATLFDGFFMTGTLIVQDFSTTGPWTLGTGWSISNGKFVHTGDTAGSITITHPAATGSGGARAQVNVTSGWVSIETNNASSAAGVGTNGIISSAVNSGAVGFTQTKIEAKGDCEVWNISAVKDGYSIAWVFFDAPAVNGSVLQPIMAYRPDWSFASVEVLGSNFV